MPLSSAKCWSKYELCKGFVQNIFIPSNGHWLFRPNINFWTKTRERIWHQAKEVIWIYFKFLLQPKNKKPFQSFKLQFSFLKAYYCDKTSKSRIRLLSKSLENHFQMESHFQRWRKISNFLPINTPVVLSNSETSSLEKLINQLKTLTSILQNRQCHLGNAK